MATQLDAPVGTAADNDGEEVQVAAELTLDEVLQVRGLWAERYLGWCQSRATLAPVAIA